MAVSVVSPSVFVKPGIGSSNLYSVGLFSAKTKLVDSSKQIVDSRITFFIFQIRLRSSFQPVASGNPYESLLPRH